MKKMEQYLQKYHFLITILKRKYTVEVYMDFFGSFQKAEGRPS